MSTCDECLSVSGLPLIASYECIPVKPLSHLRYYMWGEDEDKDKETKQVQKSCMPSS